MRGETITPARCGCEICQWGASPGAFGQGWRHGTGCRCAACAARIEEEVAEIRRRQAANEARLADVGRTARHQQVTQLRHAWTGAALTGRCRTDDGRAVYWRISRGRMEAR